MFAEKILIRPAEAFQILGVSRSKGYALLASGDIPSIRIPGSKSIRVPVAALRQMVDNLLTAQTRKMDEEKGGAS